MPTGKIECSSAVSGAMAGFKYSILEGPGAFGIDTFLALLDDDLRADPSAVGFRGADAAGGLKFAIGAVDEDAGG